MLLPIITHPNQILRQKAKEVPIKELAKQEFKQIVLDMIDTMKARGGVGLSAPQVNIGLRLIVASNVTTEAEKKDDVFVFVNPVIIAKSLRTEILDEGCLSIPGKALKIKRFKKVNIKALDLNGKRVKLKAEGLMARIIQHEIDHLDGALIIDKVSE